MKAQAASPGRPIDRTATIETALLAGAAAVLLVKAWQGVLAFYIHPRYIGLVVATGGVLLLLAAARLGTAFGRATTPARGRRGGYLAIACLILLGLALPARPLQADALSGKAIGAGGTLHARDTGGADTQHWNLLQWVTAIDLRGSEVQGEEADLSGFVYHDPARPFDGFIIARHVIVCCAADGTGIGLPVVWPGGAALAVDSWVRVRGTLGIVTIDGRSEPAFVASAVEPIPRPANPYLST